MIEEVRQTRPARAAAQALGWLQNAMAPALMHRRIILVALISTVLAALYWLGIASDRYVSTAHIVIQRTDLAGGQGIDLSNLLSGAAGGGARADQLLLRDHLLSVDMLRKLDAELDLRAHYSDRRRDALSRMWAQDNAMEWFHRHYLARTSVELDEYSGVLIVRAQAYDAPTAQAITALLVREGERFMNELAHDLARDQVRFLEGQVADMNQRAMQARQALLDFQNRAGLVSPQATAESRVALVAQLEAQRAELQTQRAALQAYLVADHPNIVQLDQHINALDRQIAREQARLAAPTGAALNRTVEEFQRLEMDANFAHEMYKTALTALERGRIEATRTIKKIAVLQAPTLPEYPMEPRRTYNTVVFMLVALLLAGVLHLLTAIVRDHKD